MRKWIISLLGLLMGWPLSAQPLPNLDDYALKPGQSLDGAAQSAQPLPSLDDYALRYKSPAHLAPNPKPPRSNPRKDQGIFYVQSRRPIAYIAGQSVSIPVRGEVNGITLDQAQLIGTFVPEGSRAGRLVFEQLVTPDQSWNIVAQTDLLPARKSSSPLDQEQDLMAQELRRELDLINNLIPRRQGTIARAPRASAPNETRSLIELLLSLLTTHRPLTTPLGGAYNYNYSAPYGSYGINSLPPTGRYPSYGSGVMIVPDLSISQAEASLRAYEDRFRERYATPSLAGELQPGQSLYITFTDLR